MVLHQVLTDEEEEESEQGMKRLIGELLPQKEARERMIRLRVTVCVLVFYSTIMCIHQ